MLREKEGKKEEKKVLLKIINFNKVLDDAKNLMLISVRTIDLILLLNCLPLLSFLLFLPLSLSLSFSLSLPLSLSPVLPGILVIIL